MRSIKSTYLFVGEFDRRMIQGHYYWYFQSALTDKQCDDIMDLGLQGLEANFTEHGEAGISAQAGGDRSKVNEAGVERSVAAVDKDYQQLAAEGVDQDNVFQRDSHVSWINDQWVYDLLHGYLQKANEDSDWNFDIDFSETIQFTKYAPNQFYGWHRDDAVEPYKTYDPEKHGDVFRKNEKGEYILNNFGDKILSPPYTSYREYDGKIRKLSISVNLTPDDTFKGGAFKIDRGPHFAGERYWEAKELDTRGSIIIFPSFLYHQVTPVTEGVRYSIVMWNLGPPWK